METKHQKYLRLKKEANDASRKASISDGKGNDAETRFWQKEYDKILLKQKKAFLEYMESDE